MAKKDTIDEKSGIINEEEDIDRPDWDDEKWSSKHNSSITGDDEENIDRPDWDDEKWREKNDKTKHIAVKSPDDTEDLAKKVHDLEEAQIADAFSGVSVLDRIKNAARSIWHHPKQRNAGFAGLGVLLLLLFALPLTRFGILNTVGVRATARVVVLDTETQTPLKNVSIEIGEVSAKTDDSGVAVLADVRLGRQTMEVIKSAYDTYSQTITISMGTNVIEEVLLLPIGTQFDLQAIDWLSKLPVVDASAEFNDSNASGNTDGELTLTIPPTDETSIEVTVGADGYKDQRVLIDTTNKKLNSVGLVIDQLHYFVSERDGRFDIYSSNADGTDQQLLIEGTGNERADIRFTISPDNKKAILATSRENITNEDGFVMRGLYLVDLESASLTKIDESERFDLAGWIGDSIVYIKIQAGASGRNPERHRLMSYNVTNETQNEIAASNFFNDVVVAQDYVYYAPSDTYKDVPQPFLFRSDATGLSKDTILDEEVWTIIRPEFNSLIFYSRSQSWYELDMNSTVPVQLESEPTNMDARLYTTNTNEESTLWIDQRDGMGVLLSHNPETGEDTVLWRQAGIQNPIRWLSESHLVFRVSTSNETADYVLNIAGGDPVKILDVSDVSGFDRYYYYY